MTRHLTINYIEFTVPDLAAAKAFYSTVFGWRFTDYGPEYTAFEDGVMQGGFTTGPAGTSNPLVVLYADELEPIEANVRAAGGTITREIFSFPGGRRFQFQDPNGLELAVWTE